VNVLIHHNDEAGVVWYSVCKESDPGYWIDSFDTKREAEKFCSDNGYTIVGFWCSIIGCKQHKGG